MRTARDWTQRELAEALGMAEQQIRRSALIANALGVTIAHHAELKSSAA